MAYSRISDSAIEEISTGMARQEQENRKLKLKLKAAKAVGQARTVGTIVGTGLGMGALRGKLEKADGSFNIPGVNFDAELALGVLITGAALMEAFGKKWSGDALVVGSTVLAGYSRGVARNWGKTGAFKLTGVGSDVSGWIGYQPANPDLVDSLADSTLL